MYIRLLLIALLAVGAFYLLRGLRSRMAADPRLRSALAGGGKRLFQLYLLRRAIPLLLRALRSLRFFR